ncbi:MAG: TetR/AcrR family transcriptional regulator [Brevinematales bacterium]|nr:TetR/AcrR family transcriptional regulator [Brevinematales bacterium]
MPKGWNEHEKEMIKRRLQTEGKKLFERFGLRKTTVDEIVRDAGISKGAFYFFYESKELLYYDITRLMQLENRKNFYDMIRNSAGSPRERFKSFIIHGIRILSGTPLYRMMHSADFEYLVRKLPADYQTDDMKSYLDEFTVFFNEWISKGWMKKIEPDAMNGLFMSIFFLILHRDDFQDKVFDDTTELMADMLASYLIVG